MRRALLDRDGVLLLLDKEALYKKALELAAYGAGLERSLAVLARGMRTLEEAVRRGISEKAAQAQPPTASNTPTLQLSFMNAPVQNTQVGWNP